MSGILKGADGLYLNIFLDNQYPFDFSYGLINRMGLKQMAYELDDGPETVKVVAVQTNDSKGVCGSGVGRNANIGEEGFTAIRPMPTLVEVPVLLEAPDFECDGPGQQNINILKRIRQKVGLSS